MDSDIGNIRAVREWSRRYFYTKQDIGFFVTKLNSGLKAYALMIIGPRNKKVTINPGNYEFTLNSDGWYRYLFFFENNSEITLAVEDGDTITYQLNEYNDTINLSPWVIATPVMISNCRPSGYITGYINGYDMWKAFDRNESTAIGMKTTADSSWVTYEFIEPTIIYKAKLIYRSTWGTRAPQSNHIYIQGSNDNSHWTNLVDAELTNFNGYETYTYEGVIDDPKEYLYYRIFSEPLTLYGQLHIPELYYYTINQSSTSYRIATPIMISDTEPSGIVTASSTKSSSSYPGWKVFDQNIDTEWISYSGDTTNPWIQYQFSDNDPRIIKKLQLWQGCYDNGVGVINFKLEASNDGESYDDLGTYVFRHTDKYYTQTFLINNSIAYLYYKITIISATSGNFSQLGFRRIDLLEEV